MSDTILLSSTGARICVGDTVKTFRGEAVTVEGWTPPTHPGSTGRVTVGGGEFFPSVIDARIVSRESVVTALVLRSQAEVIDYALRGIVPVSVRDFGDLHDYIDANCLAGMCDDDVRSPVWMRDEDGDDTIDTDLANEVQDAVSWWIKSGAFRAAVKSA